MTEPLRLTASDLYALYRPSQCELRLYLREQGHREDPPNSYQEVVRKLGERHEREYLESLRPVVDLGQGQEGDRIRRTLEAVREGRDVLYQPALRATVTVGDVLWVIRGDPDFLIPEGRSHIVRDVKVARRISDRDHPEILRQLDLYGWLYEQATASAPVRLEVYNGEGKLIVLPYNGGQRVLEEIERLAAIITSRNEPFEPVGWSKCGMCSFRSRCWSDAEQRMDVALVPGVEQGLVRALRRRGVRTIPQLLEEFDVESLAELRFFRGQRDQRVGRKAEEIIASARSITENRELPLGTMELPGGQNFVVFDIEGLPPQLDELDMVFLWGIQVFGEAPGTFQPAVAGLGDEGDRAGWEEFLSNAGKAFDRYGDLPFLHWHHYERVKVQGYIDRYGDPAGTAHRVLANLVDLLPVLRKALILPLPSYSLKEVERYVGFQRRLEEGRGDWAMARFIEACETDDETLRQEILDEIVDYNREDLEATWAVFEWMRRRS